MNRIDRISAILIQLQSKRVVKAQEIADRFEISLRTVYRDMRTLEAAGIPIIGEAGAGYSLSEGFRLPPIMFSREEATALLTAEKLVEKVTDRGTTADYRSAMTKIKAVLGEREKDFLENIDSRIHVLQPRGRGSEGLQNNVLQLAIKSIESHSVLSIDYYTNYRQEQTQREIEPIGVFYLDSYWHLIAFCRWRKDYRDFRLDRVSTARATGDLFSENHLTLKEYMAKRYEDRELQEVVLRIDKSLRICLGAQKYYNGFVSESESDDYIEMQFLTPSLEGFARWYIMFGDQAEVVRPDALIERVRAILSGISRRLELCPAP